MLFISNDKNTLWLFSYDLYQLKLYKSIYIYSPSYILNVALESKYKIRKSKIFYESMWEVPVNYCRDHNEYCNQKAAAVIQMSVPQPHSSHWSQSYSHTGWIEHTSETSSSFFEHKRQPFEDNQQPKNINKHHT